MIEECDTGVHDGVIDFQEFVSIYNSRKRLRSGALRKSLRADPGADYGLNASIKIYGKKNNYIIEREI